MNPKLLVAALPIVGGINWGLVSLAEFDLVATLTGNAFGETNTASRLVYGAVGAASLYGLYQLATSGTARTA